MFSTYRELGVFFDDVNTIWPPPCEGDLLTKDLFLLMFNFAEHCQRAYADLERQGTLRPLRDKIRTEIAKQRTERGKRKEEGGVSGVENSTGGGSYSANSSAGSTNSAVAQGDREKATTAAESSNFSSANANASTGYYRRDQSNPKRRSLNRRGLSILIFKVYDLVS